MIEVLKFTQEQRDVFRGEYNGQILEPVIDGLGNYIVGLEILRNSAFSEIHDELRLLERAEYCYLDDDGNLIYPIRQQDYSLFDGSLLCYLLPEELEGITEQQYGSYYLPKTLDMNGNIIVPIWIAYDDNFTDIWVTLRSLQQIKYKPIIYGS